MSNPPINIPKFLEYLTFRKPAPVTVGLSMPLKQYGYGRDFHIQSTRAWIKSSGKTSQNVIEFLFYVGITDTKMSSFPGFGNLEVFIVK